MRLAVFALAVTLAGAGPGWGAPCVSYEPEVVTLEGTIHNALAYGAPNFGETPKIDHVERYQSLSLDHPICVLQGDGDLNEEENNIRQIQLVPMKGTAINDRGIHSVVVGTLYHAFNGHHHTKVLMTVRKVYSNEE